MPNDLGIKIRVQQILWDVKVQVSNVLLVMTLMGTQILIEKQASPEIHTMYKDSQILIKEVQICFNCGLIPIDCRYAYSGHHHGG